MIATFLLLTLVSPALLADGNDTAGPRPTAPRSDSSGRLRCEVPVELREVGAGRFAQGDERLVLVPFVPAANVPPAELSNRLLASLALPPLAPGAAISRGPSLAAAVAVVSAADGSAALVLLGLPGDALLAQRLAQIAATCSVQPPTAGLPPPPLVANGRILDASLRLSLAVPPGTEGFVYQGSGAVRGAGFQIFLVPPVAAEPLEQRAAELVAAQGGAASPGLPVSAGLLRAAVASGFAAPGGRQLFVEAAAIDAGGPPVGAVLVADAAAQLAGQQALSLMLQSAAPGPGAAPGGVQ